MTREEAIEAIKQATNIYVRAVISQPDDGSEAQTAKIRITREDALAALQQIDASEHGVNVQVAEEGKQVIIGISDEDTTLAQLARASEFSHNDNNNGNF